MTADEIAIERRQRIRVMYHRWRCSPPKAKPRHLTMLVKALDGMPDVDIAVAIGAAAADDLQRAATERLS